MRKFLIIIGWASIVGSIGDGLIGIYALGIIGREGWEDISMSVDTLLREALPFLYWVKTLAAMVLPGKLVEWIFAMPALIYFPGRLSLSLLIGLWAFSTAKKMESRDLE